MSKSLNKLVCAAILVMLMVMHPASVSAAVATDEQAVAAANKGVEYLENNQNDDGSMPGTFGETEWAVVAVNAAGKDAADIKKPAGDSLETFLKADTPNGDAFETETKVIAIAAEGGDTKNYDGFNYNEKLKTFHTQNQIGDKQFLNDDMFGIIAIKAAGDDDLKPMAQDGLDYLIAHQNVDKGFGFATPDFAGDCCSASEIDMTAAAVVAMDAAENMNLTNPNLAGSKDGAIAYLVARQNPDGSFNFYGTPSADSTSWALIAFNVVGESVRPQALLARNWLISQQNPDGSFGYGVSTTNHVVIALLGSSWLLEPAPLTATTVPNAPTEPTKSQSAESSSDNSSAATSPTGNVLAAGTSQSSQNPKTDKSETGQVGKTSAVTNTQEKGISYGLYALAVLGLIALAWFMIQSKQEQGKV